MRKNTKDAILQSAIDLFSQKGFNATSTAEIAAAAGVAEVTVFRHFKTKKDILLAVLEQFLEAFGREVVINPIRAIVEENEGKPQRDILVMMVRDRIALLEKNSDILWIVITEMKYHPELKERIRETFGADAAAIIRRAFWQEQGNDLFPQRNTESAMRAFVGTVLSLILQHKALPEFFPRTKTLDESIEEAVDVLLYGILKGEEQK